MGKARFSVWAGLLVIAVGVLWLLANLKIAAVDVGSILSTFWPVVLILWSLDSLLDGLAQQRQRSDQRVILVGTVATALVFCLGVAILLRNLGLFHYDFTHLWAFFWPVVLILGGWSLIAGPAQVGNVRWAVMSSLESKEPGWQLSSGSYVALMGGATLDLTKATIPTGETILDLTAIMGGIDVIVPPSLPLVCEGTALLGGVTFVRNEAAGILATRQLVRPGDPDSLRRLRIRGRAVMGGIDVKEPGKSD